MAQASVKAPVGYHFMVDKNNNFYLMKTSDTGYEPHELSGFKSQLSVLMEVKTSHTSTTSTATSTARTSSTQRTTTSTRTTTARSGGY